jgi:hypothetical protein
VMGRNKDSVLAMEACKWLDELTNELATRVIGAFLSKRMGEELLSSFWASGLNGISSPG